MPQANTRRVRSTGARPVDLLDTDRQGMLPLPRTAPAVGLRLRTRLARDYHLRVDGNDYSADPRHIGRHVDITAGLDRVTITSSGTVIAEHARSWGRHQVVTDPDHQAVAARLRAAFTTKTASSRCHPDGHLVAIRALSDYDEMFGVHFDPAPIATT